MSASTCRQSDALSQTRKRKLSQYHEGLVVCCDDAASTTRRAFRRSKASVQLRCGSPPAQRGSSILKYCKALVNSGRHDWVLAEITPKWRADPAVGTSLIAGLEKLRERDPSVSRQEIEDRASVIFWEVDRSESDAKRQSCIASASVRRLRQSEQADLSLQTSQAVAGCGWQRRAGGIGADGRRTGLRLRREIMWSASVRAKPEHFTHVFALARSATAKSRTGLSSLGVPSVVVRWPDRMPSPASTAEPS